MIIHHADRSRCVTHGSTFPIARGFFERKNSPLPLYSTPQLQHAYVFVSISFEFRLSSLPRHFELRAVRTAFSNASSLNGLGKKSTAPFLRARERTSSSSDPSPVLTITCIS